MRRDVEREIKWRRKRENKERERQCVCVRARETERQTQRQRDRHRDRDRSEEVSKEKQRCMVYFALLIDKNYIKFISCHPEIYFFQPLILCVFNTLIYENIILAAESL